MIVNVFAQAMISENRQGRYVAIRAGALVLKLALNLALMPRVGVIGAAFASAIAEALVLLILLRTVPLPWRGRAGQFARLGLVSTVSLGVMLVLSGLLPVIGIVSGLVVYGAGVLLAGALAADDYDLLYRLTAALPFGHIALRFWKRDVPLNW
jgi:O-antigen/teichoic acid export membrane protein